MNVLSLFDGISCGQVALERAGIKVDNYYASEIKKTAINCTLDNYPNTIEIGDVTKVSYKEETLYTENGNFNVGKIDLLIGGSPCQDFSSASMLAMNKDHTAKGYGLNGMKSRLFYEYLRIKKEINPKYFLLENVKMKDSSEKNLNKYMGVNGIHINSELVSFQNRARIYWTNINNVTIPEDRHISFQDNKCTDKIELEQSKVNKTPSRLRMWNNGLGKTSIDSCDNITYKDKIHCLTRKQDRCPNSGLIEYKDFCRYLTKTELEKAQTLPIGYTKSLSYLQTQDVCGDGWTVDVIAHILSFIPMEDRV